jgi:hypothetical protein
MSYHFHVPFWFACSVSSRGVGDGGGGGREVSTSPLHTAFSISNNSWALTPFFTFDLALAFLYCTMEKN